jgi:hypothetical protein
VGQRRRRVRGQRLCMPLRNRQGRRRWCGRYHESSCHWCAGRGWRARRPPPARPGPPGPVLQWHHPRPARPRCPLQMTMRSRRPSISHAPTPSTSTRRRWRPSRRGRGRGAAPREAHRRGHGRRQRAALYRLGPRVNRAAKARRPPRVDHIAKVLMPLRGTPAHEIGSGVMLRVDGLWPKVGPRLVLRARAKV